MNLLKTKIGFNNGKSFVIFHNMPKDQVEGFTLTWLNDEGSKNPKDLVLCMQIAGYTAFTEKQYKRQGIITRKIK
jgi:hypothetical protein